MVRSHGVMSLLQTGAKAAVLLTLLLASAAAFAAPRSPADRARQQIEEAEFDEALKTINAALAKPDNTDAQLATLYELQGTTYLYLGREDRAREAFGKLLQAAPEYELPRGTSPKIRALFETVRADARKRPPREVQVAHEPPERVVAGEPLDIHAEISDAPEGARARLYYRRAGAAAFSSAYFASSEGGLYTARIPAFEVPAERSAYTVEYYIEVADASGRRLAGVGTALEPGLLKVPATPASIPADPPEVASESWYQKWWVWAIAGGVAAGATAAVVIPMMDDKPATLPVTVRVQQ